MTSSTTPTVTKLFTGAILLAFAAACGGDDSTGPAAELTADAGADQTVSLFDAVTLTGIGDDPEGDPLSYSWNLVSKPDASLVTLENPTEPAISIQPDEGGAYQLQLTVSDGTASATDNVTVTVALGSCDAEVDAFPVPVSADTSPFGSIDDDFLEVPFHSGFDFTFYGSTYSSVFLNTNGGMTFGAGDSNYDVAATDVTSPGIAVFWGDMDAAEYDGPDRANQMTYQACEDRFIINYDQYQDNDDDTWMNSARVRLLDDGRVVIDYGSVLSEDIMAGVFDGSHTDDRYLSVAGVYADYFNTGTGIILMDEWGQGPTHMGELSDRRVMYSPDASAAFAVSNQPTPVVKTASPDEPSDKGPKF